MKPFVAKPWRVNTAAAASRVRRRLIGQESLARIYGDASTLDEIISKRDRDLEAVAMAYLRLVEERHEE